MNAKKIVAALLAAVLLIGVGVGGTLAWLTATTGDVTNTFTVGDIAIDLKEHKLNETGTALLTGTGNEVNAESNYKIVPGDEQPKDPFVRFTKDSEPCWLFVKVEEKNNTVDTSDKKYVTYSVDTSVWTELTGVTGVYYKELEALTTTGTTYSILTNNKVSYSSTLTKNDLTKVTDDNKPQLVFTAYAVQLEAADDAAEAWAKLN
ncbi:MAG: SipW-dependent-type signal peptide-containing protein [Oscillospiraceae bacterium]|nr:SipW-dependent-type signal peptide-containing protein [Oscillospiraceae bacterium]